jgi:hypothetical protein
MNKMIETAENLEWSVRIDGNDILFSKLSPAGQDFNIQVTAEDLYDVVAELKERCDNFDCSEETYLWLDDSGHGTNGAPYDMKDLYEDMEACLKMMEELYEELEMLSNSDEE